MIPTFQVHQISVNEIKSSNWFFQKAVLGTMSPISSLFVPAVMLNRCVPSVAGRPTRRACSTFALRAPRVPGECPVKQSEPETVAEKGAKEKKKLVLGQLSCPSAETRSPMRDASSNKPSHQCPNARVRALLPTSFARAPTPLPAAAAAAPPRCPKTLLEASYFVNCICFSQRHSSGWQIT